MDKIDWRPWSSFVLYFPRYQLSGFLTRKSTYPPEPPKIARVAWDTSKSRNSVEDIIVRNDEINNKIYIAVHRSQKGIAVVSRGKDAHGINSGKFQLECACCMWCACRSYRNRHPPDKPYSRSSKKGKKEIQKSETQQNKRQVSCCSGFRSQSHFWRKQRKMQREKKKRR